MGYNKCPACNGTKHDDELENTVCNDCFDSIKPMSLDQIKEQANKILLNYDCDIVDSITEVVYNIIKGM